MMKYTIYTRMNRHGNWWCNGTIDGYDYSFEGASIMSAQCQMKELLRKLKIPCYEVKWLQPTAYRNVLPSYLIKAQTTRLTK